MYVKVNEGKPVEELAKALKIFTKMIKKSELMHELKSREHFLKPSKKRAFKRQEALRRRKREERRLARQQKYDN